MTNQIFDRDDPDPRAYTEAEYREQVAAQRKATADARALRAVRVLDRWAAKLSDPSRRRYWVRAGQGHECHLLCDGRIERKFGGLGFATPDDARIAAAEALVKEDPSLGKGL